MIPLEEIKAQILKFAKNNKLLHNINGDIDDMDRKKVHKRPYIRVTEHFNKSEIIIDCGTIIVYNESIVENNDSYWFDYQYDFYIEVNKYNSIEKLLDNLVEECLVHQLI